MQIKKVILLFTFLAFSLMGETSKNLFPEWAKEYEAGSRIRLPGWRFTDWGKRPPKGKHSGRRSTIGTDGKKLRITLENPEEPRSANMLYRALAVTDPGKKLYRLRVNMVNSSSREALVRIQMSVSGRRHTAVQNHFTVSGTVSSGSLELTVPEESKRLQVTLTLLGPGKVTFSQMELTAHEPQTPTTLPELLSPTLTLPQKTPVELIVKLPGEKTLAKGNTLTVTLPWGVRLLSHSRTAVLKNVSVKVREKTVYTLGALHPRSGLRKLLILLGSDLPVSEKTFTGSVQLETDGQKGEPVYFRIVTAHDVPAVPPRYFKIILPVKESIAPHENTFAAEGALLRSGANVLMGSRIPVSLRQMRTARIRQWIDLHIPQAAGKGLCHYETLRNETFWEKNFIPALRRQVLRYGSRHINAIICDYFLGQRRAIFCSCALCRMEFSDFAPRLPQRDIMNLSAGMLEARYAANLKKFRDARLRALWAGARLQLPVGSHGFRSRPLLIPRYTLRQTLYQKYGVFSSEAVIDLSSGAQLPDGKKYDPAVNFLTASEALREFRRQSPRRVSLTARFVSGIGRVTPEELKFEMLNLLFNGFSGIWIDLPEGTDYEYRAAVARTAALMREHENFFRRKALAKHNWLLKSEAPALKIPPVAIPGISYLLKLPAAMSPLKLMVWKSGNTTLAAAGNFSNEPLNGRLLFPSASLKWQGELNGQRLNGGGMRTRGAEITIPPRSWRFFKFSGI